jgi:hypothetical protein
MTNRACKVGRNSLPLLPLIIITMKRNCKKYAVGSMTYIQIKFDLFRVYDAQGFYCGLASSVGGLIFTF